MLLDCKFMKFVITGLCTRKCLRIHRAIRGFTCATFEFSFVVIRLRVTGPKKTGFVCLLDLLEGRGKKRWCGLMYVERL